MARPKKAKAIERLRRALDAIPDLKELRYDSPEFQKWRRNAQIAVTNTFGSDSDHIKDFNEIRFSLTVFRSRTPESRFQNAYMRGLESAASVLESMIEEIEEYWEDDSSPLVPLGASELKQSDTNEVFIVHGRDEGAKNEVARFIEKLNLVPVILHEQANLGRTIIEKFEQHAQVGFAIVLLTPDDVGSLRSDENCLNPRARQNVIFELGYFIGKLGRKRVCALVKGNVETPSDYDGVIYTPLEGSSGWKLKLIQELKNVGFKIDANRVFQT